MSKPTPVPNVIALPPPPVRANAGVGYVAIADAWAGALDPWTASVNVVTAYLDASNDYVKGLNDAIPVTIAEATTASAQLAATQAATIAAAEAVDFVSGNVHTPTIVGSNIAISGGDVQLRSTGGLSSFYPQANINYWRWKLPDGSEDAVSGELKTVNFTGAVGDTFTVKTLVKDSLGHSSPYSAEHVITLVASLNIDYSAMVVVGLEEHLYQNASMTLSITGVTVASGFTLEIQIRNLAFCTATKETGLILGENFDITAGNTTDALSFEIWGLAGGQEVLMKVVTLPTLSGLDLDNLNLLTTNNFTAPFFSNWIITADKKYLITIGFYNSATRFYVYEIGSLGLIFIREHLNTIAPLTYPWDKPKIAITAGKILFENFITAGGLNYHRREVHDAENGTTATLADLNPATLPLAASWSITNGTLALVARAGETLKTLDETGATVDTTIPFFDETHFICSENDTYIKDLDFSFQFATPTTYPFAQTPLNLPTAIADLITDDLVSTHLQDGHLYRLGHDSVADALSITIIDNVLTTPVLRSQVAIATASGFFTKATDLFKQNMGILWEVNQDRLVIDSSPSLTTIKISTGTVKSEISGGIADSILIKKPTYLFKIDALTSNQVKVYS